MLDAALKKGLGILIGAWLALAVACLFLITLGTDEAWVLNGLRSTLEPVVPGMSGDVMYTSGGVYALANLGLEWAFGSVVWVHRAASMAWLLALVVLVARLGARPGRTWTTAALTVAPMIGLPGTAEVGTLALGHSAASFLLIAGILAWSRSERPGIGRAIAVGLLLGLAAATRPEIMMVVVPLVASGAIRPEGSGLGRFRVPWMTFVPVALVFGGLAANVALLQRISAPISMEDSLSRAAASTGMLNGLVGGLLDYPRFLNKLVAGQSFEPFWALVFASIAPFWVRSDDPAERRLSALLVATGWVLVFGWLFLSPLPHLRYLWASLACFAIPMGLALSRVYDRAIRDDRVPHALSCLVLAAASLLGGLGGSFRSIVLGNGDTLSWEWSHEISLDLYRRFQAIQDEHAAIEYLKTEIPPDATVFTYLQFNLIYRAHRPVFNLNYHLMNPDSPPMKQRNGPSYMVFTPAVGPFLYLDPKAYEWYAAHSTLVKQIGRYSFYRIDGGWPEKLEDRRLLHYYAVPYGRHPLSENWWGH